MSSLYFIHHANFVSLNWSSCYLLHAQKPLCTNNTTSHSSMPYVHRSHYDNGAPLHTCTNVEQHFSMRTGLSLQHTVWRSEYISVVTVFGLLFKPHNSHCWLKVAHQLLALCDVSVWYVIMIAQ